MSDVRGVKCPGCSCRDSRVVRTDATSEGIERVRECLQCGRRVKTRETVRAVVNQRNATGSR